MNDTDALIFGGRPLLDALRIDAEASLREMLGRWVSELEPVVVYYQMRPYQPAGLTVEGHEVLYVRPAERPDLHFKIAGVGGLR